MPLAVALAALGVLGGCDVTIKDGDLSVEHALGRATQEFSRTYPLAPNGRVEVVNTNGDVEVTTGPSGTVSVSATLLARALTDDHAKSLLDASKIEEEATPEHVRLATARAGRPGGLDVHYKLVVPAEARLEVTATSGTIKADGIAGHVKVMVANGGIELTALRGTVDAASVNGHMSIRMAEVTGRLRIEATNGRVSLEVPKDVKATLNARSVNGGITVTGLNTQEATGRRIRSIESQLNGGGPEIDVRVTNGRITIEGK